MPFHSRRVPFLAFLATLLAPDAIGGSGGISLMASGTIRHATHWEVEGHHDPYRVVLPLESADPHNPHVVRSKKLRFALRGAKFPIHFSTTLPRSCSQGGTAIPNGDVQLALDGQINQVDRDMTINDEHTHSISIQFQVNPLNRAISDWEITCQDSGVLTATY